MKRHWHLVTGGPSINAWPTSRAGKLRPGMGGGGSGGDGGAAEMEANRQNRTKAAIDRINAIFNGADIQVPVGQASAYNPGQTYYNSDGSVYVPPTTQTRQEISADDAGYWTGSGDSDTFRLNQGVGSVPVGDSSTSSGYYRNVASTDMGAINKAVQDGNLYTGIQTVKGGDRQRMYDQQQQAVTELNQKDVIRQQADAERQNRFGLARAGLSGGSADVDSNAQINRLQNEGLMKATGIGQQASADLRTADERTRQSLIGMAQSGIDTGQVSSLALAGLDANAANAKSAASGATVGNVFGDLAQAYLFNQQQQAFQNGYGPYQNKSGNINSTRNTYGGQTA